MFVIGQFPVELTENCRVGTDVRLKSAVMLSVDVDISGSTDIVKLMISRLPWLFVKFMVVS